MCPPYGRRSLRGASTVCRHGNSHLWGLPCTQALGLHAECPPLLSGFAECLRDL